MLLLLSDFLSTLLPNTSGESAPDEDEEEFMIISSKADFKIGSALL